jgi:hypothetical protein
MAPKRRTRQTSPSNNSFTQEDVTRIVVEQIAAARPNIIAQVQVESHPGGAVVPVVLLVVVTTTLVAMVVVDLVGRDAPTKHSSLANQWTSSVTKEFSALSSGSRRWNQLFVLVNARTEVLFITLRSRSKIEL